MAASQLLPGVVSVQLYGAFNSLDKYIQLSHDGVMITGGVTKAKKGKAKKIPTALKIACIKDRFRKSAFDAAKYKKLLTTFPK